MSSIYAAIAMATAYKLSSSQSKPLFDPSLGLEEGYEAGEDGLQLVARVGNTKADGQLTQFEIG